MSCGLESELLADLECQICTYYKHPPIRQCANGHSYCDDCFSKFDFCPECRAPKGVARSTTLEIIHSRLNFPCKYQMEGCPTVALGVQIKDHEKFCDYAAAPCPIGQYACLWKGLKRQVKDHLFEKHPTHIHTRQKQLIRTTDFFTPNNSFFSLHDQLFRATMAFNLQSEMVFLSTYYLGQPGADDKFSYKFTFFKGNSMVEATSMMAPCVYSPEDGRMLVGHNFLMMSLDFLMQFREGTSLTYSIEIIHNC